MEDIVRQAEPRRAAARRAAREAAREAVKETDSPRREPAEAANVVRLGVSRLTTLVSGRLPRPAPDGPADAAPEPPRLRQVLPQAHEARSWALRASFMLCVALPTLLATLYYGLIASDQYVSEFRFSVRASEARSSEGSLGSMLGGAAKSMAFLDNFVVVDFVKSRQAVDALDRDVGLRNVYSSDRADFLARLPGDVPAERLVGYWDSMVESAFDLTTGIAIVKVRAFSAQDAHKVATRLMQLSEQLVNDVNSRSRKDAIRFAEEDLRRAEDRLKAARVAVREFRVTMRGPDPIKDAEATFTLASKMREEIARYSTELSRALGSMSINAPTVLVLREKLKATEEQLKQVEGRFGESAGGVKDLLPAQLAQYEDLEVERMFAEKLYQSVLGTLESARSSANMQHTYVAAFVEPALPQKALYPQRLLSIFLMMLTCAAIWCAGLLVVYAIRDHAVK